MSQPKNNCDQPINIKIEGLNIITIRNLYKLNIIILFKTLIFLNCINFFLFLENIIQIRKTILDFVSQTFV